MNLMVRGEREMRIRTLLVRVLGISGRTDVALVRSQIPEWDSLKHMELVFALEDEFGVQFDETEFARLDSPSAIAVLIEERLAA